MRRGILASRDELRSRRRCANRPPLAAIYDALTARCDLILEAAPVSEASWQSLWQQGRGGAALQAARTAQGRMLDLLLAHHVEENDAYRDRAAEELRALVGWTRWVDPVGGDQPADLCTAEAAVGVVVALDWLWEDLPEADRAAALAAVRTKALRPYRRGLDEHAPWADCYHTWNAVVNAGCSLAALALSDEDAAWERLYRDGRAALGHFLDALGPDGGWDEGIGYWGFALRYVTLLAEAARRLRDDETLYHARGMDATGLFPVYFTPHGRAAGFGIHRAVPAYGAFYLLDRRYKLPALRWWLDTHTLHRDVSTSGWSVGALALLFRSPTAKTPAAPRLEPVKVFPSIGWAAAADRWPKPGLYVAAKTGDLSAHQSPRNMNAVQVQVGDEMLLREPGGAVHARAGAIEVYELQARAHNTLTVAEQDQRIDAQGQVAAAAAGPTHRWICCDGGQACGENVRWVRQVVMVVDAEQAVGEAVFVLDELTLGAPERVDWYWHTPGRIELDAAGRCGTLEGRRARLAFAFAADVRLDVWQDVVQRGNGVPDRLLRVSAGVVGPARILSVFARRPLDGGASLRRTQEDGAVAEAVGWAVRFGPDRGRLTLAGVERA